MLHKLWFVKFEHKTEVHSVVFLFTLPLDSDEVAAEAYGRTMISPDYVDGFRTYRVEVVCETPNEVLCFEPC